MIKKILFIIFIVFVSMLIDKVLSHEGDIIIQAFNYEISTTVGFTIFLLIAFILLCYLSFYLLTIIFYPNLKKYKNIKIKIIKNFKNI